MCIIQYILFTSTIDNRDIDIATSEIMGFILEMKNRGILDTLGYYSLEKSIEKR